MDSIKFNLHNYVAIEASGLVAVVSATVVIIVIVVLSYLIATGKK